MKDKICYNCQCNNKKGFFVRVFKRKSNYYFNEKYKRFYCLDCLQSEYRKSDPFGRNKIKEEMTKKKKDVVNDTLFKYTDLTTLGSNCMRWL